MTRAATILVVDDDPDICRNLADILSDLGYHVDTAMDGPSAIELIRRKPYDVALLDLKMPGMDGLEVYRAIRQLRASTVAIIVTAYASQATTDAALAAGAWRLLPKPVDLPRLLGLIGEALDQPLVLVVDDDPELCATLWDLLRERGFRVGIAHDTPSATEQLRGTDFEVVLIDVKLPEGDGHQVFQQVQAFVPQARTVVITGHRADTEPLVEQIVRAGADAVCYKPFEVPMLLEMLDGLARGIGDQEAGVRSQESGITSRESGVAGD